MKITAERTYPHQNKRIIYVLLWECNTWPPSFSLLIEILCIMRDDSLTLGLCNSVQNPVQWFLNLIKLLDYPFIDALKYLIKKKYTSSWKLQKKKKRWNGLTDFNCRWQPFKSSLIASCHDRNKSSATLNSNPLKVLVCFFFFSTIFIIS